MLFFNEIISIKRQRKTNIYFIFWDKAINVETKHETKRVRKKGNKNKKTLTTLIYKKQGLRGISKSNNLFLCFICEIYHFRYFVCLK